jgi:transcriptional regulator with XRE-family HTH domain
VIRDENLALIGGRVRSLRKEKGWSQEELAERSDVHRNFIGMIERGERNVGIMTLVVLAQALDLTLADLFTGLKLHKVPLKSQQ